jgi:predicted MPP superfamily phosphohydrolase
MSNIKKINYLIETKNINKRIILLSDIHFYSVREKIYTDKITEELKKMEYDYLCIAGDLVDLSHIKEEGLLIDWLKNLAELSMVIISIGNHELYKNRKTYEYTFNRELFDKIKKIRNIKVLDNETFIDSEIRFIGLSLPIDFYYRYKESKSYFMRYVNNNFQEPYNDKYNILLCHTPTPFTDKEIVQKTRLLSNVQLILCGHMHGAITPKCIRRIMKGRGLIGPSKNLFPKHSYGLIKNGVAQNIIISSGVTTASHVNAFSFIDSLFIKEITIIDLKSKK